MASRYQVGMVLEYDPFNTENEYGQSQPPINEPTNTPAAKPRAPRAAKPAPEKPFFPAPGATKFGGKLKSGMVLDYDPFATADQGWQRGHEPLSAPKAPAQIRGTQPAPQPALKDEPMSMEPADAPRQRGTLETIGAKTVGAIPRKTVSIAKGGLEAAKQAVTAPLTKEDFTQFPKDEYYADMAERLSHGLITRETFDKAIGVALRAAGVELPAGLEDKAVSYTQRAFGTRPGQAATGAMQALGSPILATFIKTFGRAIQEGSGGTISEDDAGSILAQAFGGSAMRALGGARGGPKAGGGGLPAPRAPRGQGPIDLGTVSHTAVPDEALGSRAEATRQRRIAKKGALPAPTEGAQAGSARWTQRPTGDMGPRPAPPARPPQPEEGAPPDIRGRAEGEQPAFTRDNLPQQLRADRDARMAAVPTDEKVRPSGPQIDFAEGGRENLPALLRADRQRRIGDPHAGTGETPLDPVEQHINAIEEHRATNDLHPAITEPGRGNFIITQQGATHKIALDDPMFHLPANKGMSDTQKEGWIARNAVKAGAVHINTGNSDTALRIGILSGGNELSPKQSQIVRKLIEDAQNQGKSVHIIMNGHALVRPELPLTEETPDQTRITPQGARVTPGQPAQRPEQLPEVPVSPKATGPGPIQFPEDRVKERKRAVEIANVPMSERGGVSITPQGARADVSQAPRTPTPGPLKKGGPLPQEEQPAPKPFKMSSRGRKVFGFERGKLTPKSLGHIVKNPWPSDLQRMMKFGDTDKLTWIRTTDGSVFVAPLSVGHDALIETARGQGLDVSTRKADRGIMEPHERGLMARSMANPKNLSPVFRPEYTPGGRKIAPAATEASPARRGLPMKPARRRAKYSPSGAAAPHVAPKKTAKDQFLEATKGFQEAAQFVQHQVAPATTKLGRKTAYNIRKELARGEFDATKAIMAVREEAKATRRLPEADQHAITDYIEQRKRTTRASMARTRPDLVKLAKPLITAYEDARDQIERKLYAEDWPTFIKNFASHIWEEDPNTVVKKLTAHYVSRTGSSRTFRQRHIPTQAEGIAAGLTPKFHDPYENFQHYIFELERYLGWRRVIDYHTHLGAGQGKWYYELEGDQAPGDVEIKGAPGKGPLIKGRPPKGSTPPGPTFGAVPREPRTPSGPTPKGSKSRPYQRNRKLYGPPDSARVANALFSNEGPWEPLVNGMLRASNLMRTLEFALSARHAAVMTVEGIIGDVRRSFEEVLQLPHTIYKQGPVTGAKHALKATTTLAGAPFAPVTRAVRGAQMRKQAFYGSMVGSKRPPDPMQQKVIDLFIDTGGSFKMPDIYGSFYGRNFAQSIGEGTFFEDAYAALKGIVKKPVLGTWRLIANVIQSVAAPLMEHYVPNMKLGAFAASMQDWLERNPQATEEEKYEQARKYNDHIDDALGELQQRNLFWRQGLKKALMMMLTSFTWDLGTQRAIAGGVADLPKSAKNFLLGKGMEPRTVYVAALAFTTALINDMYTYVRTGDIPATIEQAFISPDAFAGRTGGENIYGDPERAELPGYQNDVYGWYYHPGQELYNKLSMPIKTVLDYSGGKDWRGMMMYKPDDVPDMDPEHEPKVIDDVLDRIAPWSLSSALRPQNTGSAISPLERAMGIHEAPKEMENPELAAEMKQVRDIAGWKKRVRSDAVARSRTGQDDQ